MYQLPPTLAGVFLQVVFLLDFPYQCPILISSLISEVISKIISNNTLCVDGCILREVNGVYRDGKLAKFKDYEITVKM